MKIITASKLDEIANDTDVSVAGLVITRQRPSTSNGVIFLTLEDETGTINIICWESVYKKFRHEIIHAQLLMISGKLQKSGGTTHVIARSINNLSELLDFLPELDF